MRFIRPFTFFTLQTNLSTETDLIESFSMRTWPRSFTINKLFLTNPMYGSVGHFNWNVMLFCRKPNQRCQSFSLILFNSKFENWKQRKVHIKKLQNLFDLFVEIIFRLYHGNNDPSTLINVAIKEIKVVIFKMISLLGTIFKY